MAHNYIQIENLKGIKEMNFKIPNPGVHVITASNGSGKTTLITCIARLSDSRSFNTNFIQHRASNVDSYLNSKITYVSRNNSSVTYTYREGSDSWRPTTQNTSTMREFGFGEIIVIPTLGKRVYIQRQTIGGGTVRAASASLREAMSSVLENPKFNELRKINLGETRGRRGRNRRSNTAFILIGASERGRDGRLSRTYYSESSFSLGEIFTLNLLFELETISDNSLLVIDELEVALHPKVQINLLNYLKEKAIEKNLTILVSTHSSSLIKCSPSLIYLDSDNEGVVKVHYNCYPTLALKEVAVEEDMQPDFVFFVEDDAAVSILREMILIYLNINPTRHKPLWKILPIGGFQEVLKFTKNADSYLLNRRIGQYAFLDQDVLQSRNDLRHKGNNRTDGENRIWQLFQELENKIKYLNITPELGVWEWLRDNPQTAQTLINDRFPDSSIDMNVILRNCNTNFPNVSNNPREDAKNRLSWINTNISSQTNEDVKRVRQHLFSAFCENYFSIQDNRNELNRLLGPIFRHQ
jgi:predicted ATPase